MRVAVLTTAYAAHGRGAALRRLVGSMTALGHEVHVFAPEDAATDACVDGVADYPPVVSVRDRLAWTLQINAALQARATAHVRAAGCDVVHAVGWDVAWAAVGLRRALDVPLVATVPTPEPKRDLTEEHRAIARQAAAWLMREAGAHGVVLLKTRAVLGAYEQALESARRHLMRASAAPVPEVGSLA